MPGNPSLSPLLIVVGLALAVPFLLSRVKWLRVPIVVGEILAGVAVGRSGFDLVNHESPLLHLLAELGFVFLMFLSGIEVDFSRLTASRPRGPGAPARFRGPLPIAALNFALTFLASVLAGFVLWQLGMVRNPWMMALILSTTSLGVVVPVLKERGLSTGRYGQTLVIAALVADFMTMLLITVLVGLLARGATTRILLIGALFAAVFLLYRLGLVINRLPAVRRSLEELSHATAQIKVRAAFALMLVFVALSEAFGTEVILGAFMAGAIIALLRTEDERLQHQLEGVGFGFFIPVFFIMVGVEFNLPALFASREALLLLPVLLGAAVLVKIIPGLVFRLAFGWRESLGAGVLLSARLSLIIAAAAIGRDLGVISDSVNAAIILVAILTVTAAPPLFALLVPGRDPAKARPIVVVGAGELGLQVAHDLQRHGEKVLVIDADADRAARARRRGFAAETGEIDREEPALTPLLDQAQALICTYADTGRAYRICEFLRSQFGLEHLVALVSEPGDVARFQRLGVATMNMALDGAALLVMLARNPAIHALLSRTDDDKEVFEMVVRGGEKVGQRVGELHLPGDVLVVSVWRRGELLMPRRDLRIETGDRLVLLGSVEAVSDARRESMR
ncbi:MAG TPA: cation:proton antiporter [Opitutus sp.]|nr:cation:proton antiporter [Opitutus sp.]